MVKEEFILPDTEDKGITLTRAEMDALTEYDAMVRKDMIWRIFADVEQLLQMSYRTEEKWAKMCNSLEDRGCYLYGRNLCEKLLIDLLQIKKRYME